ncbi:endolysin [Arthrobacter phage Kitkat]|uniref:Endolysin n=2 Tax=Kelleziovirus kitkat TaxID=1982238 RepID=A0A140G6T2_9CAUD|nr:endolysin [Arthrobacter phage Kitkat]AMM44367.1 endolysin [Arthrobacter phage Kitkat]QGJ96452.1 endolysin [Arthrobacter phage BeatusComedenti]
MSTLPIQEEWFGSVLGVSLNPDRFAGNQCVDTVDHYGEFIFGVPWSVCVGGVVGARDLMRVAPSKYWEKIPYTHGFVPQRGDVAVFDGDNLNQYGHTAPIEAADWLKMYLMQQDGFAYPWQWVDGAYYSAKPAHRAALFYSQAGTGPLAGVLRPRKELMVGYGDVILSGEIINEEDELSDTAADRIIAHIDARLDFIALPGETKIRNAGPLYPLATKVDRIDAALLPGIEGQRHAGVVYAALEAVKAQSAEDKADMDPVEMARALAAAFPADFAKQVVAELGKALS